MTVEIPESLELITFDELAEDDDINHGYCGSCNPVQEGDMVICFCGTLTIADNSDPDSRLDCEECKTYKACPNCGERMWWWLT